MWHLDREPVQTSTTVKMLFNTPYYKSATIFGTELKPFKDNRFQVEMLSAGIVCHDGPRETMSCAVMFPSFVSIMIMMTYVHKNAAESSTNACRKYQLLFDAWHAQKELK